MQNSASRERWDSIAVHVTGQPATFTAEASKVTLMADGHSVETMRVRVLDLRWLNPLPVEDILREADVTGRVLVVDETRRSGGIAEGVLATLVDHSFRGVMARVTSKDSFIPLGDAANLVLLSEAEIEAAAHSVVRRALR